MGKDRRNARNTGVKAGKLGAMILAQTINCLAQPKFAARATFAARIAATSRLTLIAGALLLASSNAARAANAPTSDAAFAAERLTRGALPADVYAFKQRVYQMHVESSAMRAWQRGDERVLALAPAQTARVPGTRFVMRADAAAALGRLLRAARRDLAAQRNAPASTPAARLTKARARRVNELGLNSTYRPARRQFELWDGYFLGFYRQLRPQLSSLPGGVHGDAAALVMLNLVAERIGAPGYSNHQRGIAVDFKLGMTAPKNWEDYWLWHWLNGHAREFGFVPYAPEAWHWEFKPAQASAPNETPPAPNGESQ